MDSSHEILTAQMQTIQGLYGELFDLMLQNIETQQAEEVNESEAPANDPMAGRINEMMELIDGNMREFRERVAFNRQEKLTSDAMEHEIDEFNQQLKESLIVIQRRLAARMRQIQANMDNVRDKMRTLQRKRTGVRGYKPSLARGGYTAQI